MVWGLYWKNFITQVKIVCEISGTLLVSHPNFKCGKLIVIKYEYNFLEGKIACFYGLNMLAGNCDLIDPNVKIK